MNRIKPNDRSPFNQENERDYSATGDDHGYVSSIYQWGKNSLMNQIKPNNVSQKLSHAVDTTDGHSYLYNSGMNSSVNQIKPNHASFGPYPNGHSGVSVKSGYNYSSSRSEKMNQIKPNIISFGYHRLMDTVEFGQDLESKSQQRVFSSGRMALATQPSASQRPPPDPLIPPVKVHAEPSTETTQGQVGSYASLIGPTKYSAAVATPGQSAAVMALYASRPPASPVRIEPWPTFASVARPKLAFRFPPLQLPARQPAIKDGKPAVFFTTSEIQSGVQRLQHSLIAKFSADRPSIDMIRRCFTENWAISDGSTIGALDVRHILIILTSEDESNRILAHPLRKAGLSLFRLFRWTPDFRRRKEPTTTTTWVKLPGLPSHLFDQGYISSIVSTFARFIAIDEKTRMYSKPSFARACIELDLTKPIPGEVWVGFGNSHGFWQPITYENKLLYCSKCKLHGHELSACLKIKSSAATRGLPVPNHIEPDKGDQISVLNITQQMTSIPRRGGSGLWLTQLQPGKN
ncbi:hypothetical protein QQ045_016887 [Rhodiola kirilowii]